MKVRPLQVSETTTGSEFHPIFDLRYSRKAEKIIKT
jgi:hypothetical protein